MVRQRRGQPGEGRASRELCTFYTFVLCTALLILHPIMLLLEPICKKLLQKFICVYVKHPTQKQERKNSSVMYRFFFLSCFLFFSFMFCFCFVLFFGFALFQALLFIFNYLFFFFFCISVSFGFMGALILQQRSEGCRSILSIRYVALPSKLGVSLQR